MNARWESLRARPPPAPGGRSRAVDPGRPAVARPRRPRTTAEPTPDRAADAVADRGADRVPEPDRRAHADPDAHAGPDRHARPRSHGHAHARPDRDADPGPDRHTRTHATADARHHARSTCTARARWSASTRTTGACRPRRSRWSTWSAAPATGATLTQKFYYKRIRSPQPLPLRTRGNDPQGWAWGLRDLLTGRAVLGAGVHEQATGPRRDRRVDRENPRPGRCHRPRRHARLGGPRLPDQRTTPSSRRRRRSWVLRERPARLDRRQVAVRVPDHRPVQDVFTRYHEWQRRVIWEGKWVVIAQ